MLNEVELMEELPYYRTLQKPPQHHHQPPISTAPHYPTAPRGGYRSTLDNRLAYDDETAIAIIAPDIRMPQQHHHHNSPLSIESPSRYTPLGCADVLASLLALALDVGTDALACYVLFAEGRTLWASLAAAFVLLASAVCNVLSLWWYIRNQRTSVYAVAGTWKWVVRIIFHVLCMGLLYR